MPNPHLGHPIPFATRGGKASGNDAAEKKVMLSTGYGGLSAGGSRIPVASSVFSGIERKEGILYLHSLC